MVKGNRNSGRRAWWILGGAIGLMMVLVVMGAVLLPIVITRWLGGDQFRQLASGHVSSLLQTEGEFEDLEWSSFSVYSAGFRSRTGASGPMSWDLREIRTEISPRLLLDRILRFSVISIGALTLSPGSGVAVPPRESIPPVAAPGGTSSDLLRDVQVGSVEIQSIQMRPVPATGEWGVQGMRAVLRPTKQKFDFTLEGGEILTPFSWLGNLLLSTAKGRYSDSTVYLTSLDAKSPSGGTLQISGEYMPGPSPRVQGRLSWERWSVPGGKIGVGLFEVPARMSGDFVLQEIRPGGPVGQGEVRLVEARLEPGPGSKTILGLLGTLSGEPRLQGCPLTTAQARWSAQPSLYDVNRILVEAPGLLRVMGQVRVSGQNLSGQLQLGLERNLGSKVNGLTGGECFRREEDGYVYETVNLSGTMENPQNDLTAKLSSAIARTAVRTGMDILQKATGSTDPASPAGAAGQILKSIFGPPSGQ